MRTKTKWIIIGLVILLSLAIALTFNPIKKRYQRYFCGTNLRDLGKAGTVYGGKEYSNEYTVHGGGPNEHLPPDDPNLIMMRPSDPNWGI